MIGQIIDQLLQIYDVVVRCDVDEFIVADPAKYSDLRELIESNRAPFITALGMDVIQYEEEDDLEIGSNSIMQQRSYCVATASICKTSIVTHSMRWSIGFHWTDFPPMFGDAYLFHLKFADVRRRIKWFDYMKALSTSGSIESSRYSDGSRQIGDSAYHLRNLPKQRGLTRFRSRSFFDDIVSATEIRDSGFRVFPFSVDTVAREIPDDFKALF